MLPKCNINARKSVSPHTMATAASVPSGPCWPRSHSFVTVHLVIFVPASSHSHSQLLAHPTHPPVVHTTGRHYDYDFVPIACVSLDVLTVLTVGGFLHFLASEVRIRKSELWAQRSRHKFTNYSSWRETSHTNTPQLPQTLRAFL